MVSTVIVGTSAIAQITRAKQLLEQAKDLRDIKAIRDMAEAARLYARAAGLGGEAIIEASEIARRAERKGGEALAAMDKQHGARTPQRDSPEESRPPLLADIGITPKQSMQWQDEAALPDEQFEEIAAEAKAEQKPLTSTTIARKGRAHKRAQATTVLGQSNRSPEAEQRRRSPVNSQAILDARLAADFLKAMKGVTTVAAYSPERIVEVMGASDAEWTQQILDRILAWSVAFRAARESPARMRVMGGS